MFAILRETLETRLSDLFGFVAAFGVDINNILAIYFFVFSIMVVELKREQSRAIPKSKFLSANRGWDILFEKIYKIKEQLNGQKSISLWSRWFYRKSFG
jgi:hypothetical protein